MRQPWQRTCWFVLVLFVVAACAPGGAAPFEPPPGPAQAAEPDPEVDKTPPPSPSLQEIARGTLLQGAYILDTSDGSVLTVDETWQYVMSPVGHVLAGYGFNGAAGIAVIDLDDGTMSTVADDMRVFRVQWSPDGERLAFVRIRDGGGGSQDTNGVHVVNRDGTALHRVADTKHGVYVQWSADGRFIAYTESADDGATLHVVKVETDAVAVFTAELSRDQSLNWRWSPDGARVAWLTPDGYTVYDSDSDTAASTALASPGNELHWRQDGVHVFSADPNMNNPSLVLAHQTPAGETFNLGPMHWRTPTWQPDADTIAYVSDGCREGAFDVMLVRGDGTEPRALTTDGEVKTTPVWRPDGTAVAFGQIGKLLIADTASAEVQTLLTDYSMYGAPSVTGWSADGRYIAFQYIGRGVCD